MRLVVALDVAARYSARCSGSMYGGDRRHSGGFLLRIMPPSWHPVPACAPRPCCRRAVLRCCYDCCRRNCSTLRRRKLESDAVRYYGRDRCPTTMLQAELFYFAGTMPLQRSLISGPDLRIDVAKRPKRGQSLHRFSISSPDL